MNSSGGKGSSPRPFSITQEQYDQRWDAIFNRDGKQTTLIEVIDYDSSVSLITEDGTADD
jgi:hypothetical protein